MDLFFVISGFIMVHVSRREPSPTAFLRARAMRVVPLCWLATLTATWTALKRLWRNALLSASDETFASDRTVSEATKQAWAAHRKAPRDLPTTPCFPANTNWPTPPASVK